LLLLEFEGGTFDFDTLDMGVKGFLAEALGDDSLLAFKSPGDDSLLGFASLGDVSVLATLASLGDVSLLGAFADLGDDSRALGVDGVFLGVLSVTEDKEALTFVPIIFFGCGDVNLFLLRI